MDFFTEITEFGGQVPFNGEMHILVLEGNGKCSSGGFFHDVDQRLDDRLDIGLGKQRRLDRHLRQHRGVRRRPEAVRLDESEIEHHILAGRVREHIIVNRPNGRLFYCVFLFHK